MDELAVLARGARLLIDEALQHHHEAPRLLAQGAVGVVLQEGKQLLSDLGQNSGHVVSGQWVSVVQIHHGVLQVAAHTDRSAHLQPSKHPWRRLPHLILSSERVVRLEESCWMSDSSTGWLRGQECCPNTCWDSMVSHTYSTRFRSVAESAWTGSHTQTVHQAALKPRGTARVAASTCWVSSHLLKGLVELALLQQLQDVGLLALVVQVCGGDGGPSC